MTPEQFWNDDGSLMEAYEIAYINNMHINAHIQGRYNYLALSVIFSNLFAKKGSKEKEYPQEDIYNPYNEKNIKNKNFEKMTEKEKDEIYRSKMSFWNKFVKNRKGKKKEGEH